MKSNYAFIGGGTGQEYHLSKMICKSKIIRAYKVNFYKGKPRISVEFEWLVPGIFGCDLVVFDYTKYYK